MFAENVSRIRFFIIPAVTHFDQKLGYVLVVLNLSIPKIIGVNDSMMTSS